MVNRIHKKDRKYIVLDGREYGPKSLYFHIKRTLSLLEFYTKNGGWDKQKQMEMKAYIERYMKAFRENFDDEIFWLLNYV